MSFEKDNNALINSALLFIAIGLTIATGSLYRFIYSYNLIMLVTMIMMVAVVSYQILLPSYRTNNSILSYNVNKINYSGLMLILFMLFFVLLSDVVNKIKSMEIVIFYSAMLLVTILIDESYRKRIFNIYLNIIVVLSVISIIFLILAIFTDFLSSLPAVRSTTHFITDFYYVASVNPNLIWLRNQSIFWEPGAFGYHLMIAILFAFQLKKKKHLAILVATAITTLSTSVFIFLFMVFLYLLFFSKKRILVLTAVGSFILVAYFIIVRVLDNKLLIDLIAGAIFEKFNPTSDQFISFAGRSMFTIEAFNMFLDNLFIGAGHYASSVKLEVVQKGYTTATSGLAGLLAEFGLYGVICILIYIRFFRYFKIFAVPIALIWLNGEFLQYSPMSLFILADSANGIAKKWFP